MPFSSSHRHTRLQGVMCVTLAVLLIALIAASSSASAKADPFTAVVRGNRHEQIHFWEKEILALRQKEQHAALARVYNAQAALDKAKKREGFFFTKKEDRATIKVLDEAYHSALVELNTVRAQESMMLDKLRPLYGVVSTQLAGELRAKMSDSVSFVKKVSYDNAWYSSLWRVGEAESITDLIVGFVMEWMVGYICLYPFAVVYYAILQAPATIYSYTSGVLDVPAAVMAYLLSVFVAALPLILVAAGLYLVMRFYGPRIQAAMREQQRRREEQHYHMD